MFSTKSLSCLACNFLESFYIILILRKIKIVYDLISQKLNINLSSPNIIIKTDLQKALKVKINYSIAEFVNLKLTN